VETVSVGYQSEHVVNVVVCAHRPLYCFDALAYLDGFHAEQFSQFFNFAVEVAYTHRTMVGGAVAVPSFHECACANRKAVAAVSIADFEDGAGHGFAFGNKERDGQTWRSLGPYTFENSAVKQYFDLIAPASFRHFRIEVKSDYKNGTFTAIAEIGTYRR